MPDDFTFDIWNEMEIAAQRVELRKIREDPNGNRLTGLMGSNGSSYQVLDAGKNANGESLSCCHSSWKNAAGFYLYWLEIETETEDGWEVRRVDWQAFKKKKTAIRMTALRAEKLRAENGLEPKWLWLIEKGNQNA